MALYAYVCRRDPGELDGGDLVSEYRYLVESLALQPLNRTRIRKRLDQLTTEVRARRAAARQSAI